MSFLRYRSKIIVIFTRNTLQFVRIRVCLFFYMWIILCLYCVLLSFPWCLFSPVFCLSPVLSFVSLCGHRSPVFYSTHWFISFTCCQLVSPPPHTIYGLPCCLVSQVFPIVSRYPSVSVLFKPQCFSFWLLVRLILLSVCTCPIFLTPQL